MVRYEVFIPAALESELNVTLRVEADNWMAALKSGLKRLGDRGAQVSNILVDIMEDDSIHVTDSVGGRVFRIRELGEAVAAPTTKDPVRAAKPEREMPAAVAPPEPALAPSAATAAAPTRPVAPAPRPQPAAASARSALVAAPKPRPSATPPPPPQESEADEVEELAQPLKPVSGPIGRERTNGRVEDLLGDLFERVAEIDGLERPRAMSLLLDLAMEAIPADAGSVFVSHLSQPELTVACARGPKARELEAMKLRMPMGVGIVGFCAQEAVSLAISDTEKDPRFHREVSEKIGYPTKSILCAPMVVEGRTFGCVEIINKRGSSHFSDTELAALAYLAHQGARYLERQG